MMRHSFLASLVFFLCICLFCAIPGDVAGQTLDGSPYDPAVDPNIDLNMGSWHDSEPYMTHGTLEERDILTRGDPLEPPAKGAVLRHMKRFTRAYLEAGTETTPVTLAEEQEVYYVYAGTGTLSADGERHRLEPGIALLIPPDVPFTLAADDAAPLECYLVVEPVPEGFTPNGTVRVADEGTAVFRTSSGHWSHIVKELFMEDDGLATLEAFLTVVFAPMTMGQPHSHDEAYGSEEVWTTIEGSHTAFIGKQVRTQPPGTAYNIPPDGNTPHSNINTTDRPVKLLYFAVGAGALGSGERFGTDEGGE